MPALPSPRAKAGEPAASLAIGVLALQGGYAAHASVLAALGQRPVELRTAKDLKACDALILPGGESTTMTRLIDAAGAGFRSALEVFCATKPVMGTCAGLILLSKYSGDERVRPFGVLPVTLIRNAYGRQNESSVRLLELDPAVGMPPGGISKRSNSPSRAPDRYRGIFIRAPRIVDWDDEVVILAREPTGREEDHQHERKGAPVLVRYRHILALSFHPELTPEDTRIHAYFLAMCRGL